MASTDFPRYPTREAGGDNASVKGYEYALLWYLDSLTPQYGRFDGGEHKLQLRS
jgi:hypothetical protein